MRQQLRIVRWLGVLMVVVGLFALGVGAIAVDFTGILIGLAAVGLGAFYAFAAKRLAYGRTRKVNERIFRERWTEAMGLPTRLWISAKGIAAASQLTSSTVAWPAVAEIQRTDLAVIFWLGPNGIIVPSRAFASADDLQRFAGWAEHWWEATR